MKSIYLCGPVTGRPREEAFGHFLKVEARVRLMAENAGVPVSTTNPLRECQPELGWHEAMKLCVSKLAHCDGLALLQGWEYSDGAKLELKLANDLHIPVVYIEPPADCIDLAKISSCVPEAIQYYQSRLSRLEAEGTYDSAASDRAIAELANRYLDPHGFEYINTFEEG